MNLSVGGCQYGICILSQKYVVSTMVCASMILLYGTRFSITSTTTYLREANRPYNRSPSEYCHTATNSLPMSSIKEKLDWTDNEATYINSAFYVGYILSHIPSGMIGDLYGAKHFLSTGILGSGITCIIVPFILMTTSWRIFVIIQVWMGIMQGICMPAIYTLMAAYVPRYQASLLVAYGYSGGAIGVMIQGVMTSYFIMTQGRWKLVFYTWGGLSVLLYFNIIFFIYSRPLTHPFISEKEKRALAEEFGPYRPTSIPWKEILKDSGLWAMISAQFGHTFLLFNVNTHLPRFFVHVLSIDLTNDLYLIIIPNMCHWCFMLLSGYFADYVIRMKYSPTSYIRVFFSGIGIVIPNLFMIFATYANCNKVIITISFTLYQITKAAVFSGIKTNIMDLTRNYAGTVQAFQNGIPSITGLISPIVVKYMCVRNTLQEWRKVFCMSLAICMFAMTLYFVWGEGDQAEWDDVKKYNEMKSRRLKNRN